MSRTRLRLRHFALALAALLAAQGTVTLVLLVPRVKAALRARLERALGRPVEVGRFNVSVWSGLRLEAKYITVGEDPRFGYEFVLRADQLSASPRWQSLLRGRLEFARFSFERPSLNLVRGPDAHWNFESWAAGSPGRGNTGAASAVRGVDAISFSNGRINFKRDRDKLPFALIGVNGQLSPAPDGRWNLNIDAQPLRAGVTLQDAGTLRFVGTFPLAAVSATGATQSLPAVFSMEWIRVSLSDAFRLIAGNDFGVRGSLAGTLNGRFGRPAAVAAAPNEASRVTPDGLAAPAWMISATLRLADVHRWDLPLQSGAPALNLSLDAAGSADRREWEFREILLEARRSNLRGAAAFRLGENSRASLRVVSASVHLDDLLAWYRAFHPGVRPGTAVEGFLGADVALEGWPLSVVHATLATTGARLTIPGESREIELRRAVLEADAKGVRLVETQLAAGPDEPGLRLAGHSSWAQGMPFEASLTGGTAHLTEFSTAIAALGLSAATNPLRVEGTASARLDWKGIARPWHVATTGTLALDDVTLSGGLLRTPITVSKSRLDFLPGRRRLQIGVAKAIGAVWTGRLNAETLAGPWEFALAADRLNPAQAVRGFANQPPDESSLLSRILPAQAAATLALETPRWPAWLRGEGTLTAGTLSLGRLEFDRLKGHLSIGERGIAFEGAEAAAYGGRVRGEVRADFGEQPHYSVRADFDGVNVAPLASLTVSARDCCTGMGAGHVELKAVGWTRDTLFASLTGTGRAEVRSGALLTLDLLTSTQRASLLPGRTPVREASAGFSFSSGRVQLGRLVLELPGAKMEGTGGVSYRGELDVAIAPQRDSAKPASSGIHITGTLAAPQVSPQKQTP